MPSHRLRSRTQFSSLSSSGSGSYSLQVNGDRPFVEVYATCTGSCKMTAEDRRKHPGFSTRSAAKEFDPAKHLVGALKNLVSKHKFCFRPRITELTWELLSSSRAVAGPSASHATTEPPVSQPSKPTAVLFNGGAPLVPPGDGCGDTSTAMTILESDQRHALYCGAKVALREDVA